MINDFQESINGSDVKLRDIGEAVLGPENEESVLKESNVPMIAIAIVPQPGTNYISISNDVQKRLEEITKYLPQDILIEL